MNPHVLEVLDWGFEGLWSFMTGVSVPDQDGDALPQISQFCRYLNILKRTQHGRVINCGPCGLG